MENVLHENRALKLVGGNSDEQRTEARRYCAELVTHFLCFSNRAEKSLRPGMLAQWKPGMKNRKMPEYGMPMVVVEVLATPIEDTAFDSGSIYFREKLDIILGFVDDEGEFSMLHYDARRFKSYAGGDAE